MQWLIFKIAWLMQISLGTSATESMVAAGWLQSMPSIVPKNSLGCFHFYVFESWNLTLQRQQHHSWSVCFSWLSSVTLFGQQKLCGDCLHAILQNFLYLLLMRTECYENFSEFIQESYFKKRTRFSNGKNHHFASDYNLMRLI